METNRLKIASLILGIMRWLTFELILVELILAQQTITFRRRKEPDFLSVPDSYEHLFGIDSS